MKQRADQLARECGLPAPSGAALRAKASPFGDLTTARFIAVDDLRVAQLHGEIGGNGQRVRTQLHAGRAGGQRHLHGMGGSHPSPHPCKWLHKRAGVDLRHDGRDLFDHLLDLSFATSCSRRKASTCSGRRESSWPPVSRPRQSARAPRSSPAGTEPSRICAANLPAGGAGSAPECGWPDGTRTWGKIRSGCC